MRCEELPPTGHTAANLTSGCVRSGEQQDRRRDTEKSGGVGARTVFKRKPPGSQPTVRGAVRVVRSRIQPEKRNFFARRDRTRERVGE